MKYIFSALLILATPTLAKEYPQDIQEALDNSPDAHKDVTSWDNTDSEGFIAMEKDMGYLQDLWEYYRNEDKDPVILDHMNKIFLDYANTTKPSNISVDDRLFANFSDYFDDLRRELPSSDVKTVKKFLQKMASKLKDNKKFHMNEAKKGNYNTMIRFLDVLGSIALAVDDSKLLKFVYKDKDYSLSNSWKKSIESSDLKKDYQKSNPNCDLCVKNGWGCTTDFCRRDSMSYHTVHIHNGIHLLQFTERKNPSMKLDKEKNLLKKAIDFIVPYLRGDETHLEYTYSSANKDKEKDGYNKPYKFGNSVKRKIKAYFPEYKDQF